MMLLVLLAQATDTATEVVNNPTGYWVGLAGFVSALMMGLRQFYTDFRKTKGVETEAKRQADAEDRKAKVDENDRRYDRLEKERDELDNRYKAIDAERLGQIKQLESEMREIRKAETECRAASASLQATVNGLTERLNLMAKLQDDFTKAVTENAEFRVRLEYVTRERDDYLEELRAVRGLGPSAN